MASIIEESKKARQVGLFGFWRSKKFIYGIVLFLIFGTAYYFYSNRGVEKDVVNTKKDWTVKTGDILLSVEADGQVVAKDGVDLSFSVSGDNLEVDKVFVNEGDKIKKGDKIASVKTDTLGLSLRSAWSNYQSVLAGYNETMDGATDEEIQNAKDKITNAEISLRQAKTSLESTIQDNEDKIYDAQKKVDDTKKDYDKNSSIEDSEDIRDAYESLVDQIKSVNISLGAILKNSDEILGVDKTSLNDDFEENLGAKDRSTFNEAKQSYVKAKEANNDLNESAIGINNNSDSNKIDMAGEKASLTLDKFEAHLYDMKLLLDNTITSVDFSQNKLDSFISLIISNRSNVNSKITALNSQLRKIDDIKENIGDYKVNYEEALKDLERTKNNGEINVDNEKANIANKEISLDQAKRDLESLEEPLTDFESANANSKLTSASVNLQKAQYDMEKATLTSPIDGQISQLNYASGDIITDSNKSVATVINNDTLFIELNIEEADISALQVGQKAYATFDALDGLELEGEVSFISLTSDTNNNGIVTYLVRVLFSKGEHEIREGMTANVNFVSSEARGVLVAPVAAVRNVSGKPSVKLKDGDWSAVVTGLTDGKYVEVISGLSEGDKITY